MKKKPRPDALAMAGKVWDDMVVPRLDPSPLAEYPLKAEPILPWQRRALFSRAVKIDYPLDPVVALQASIVVVFARKTTFKQLPAGFDLNYWVKHVKSASASWGPQDQLTGAVTIFCRAYKLPFFSTYSVNPVGYNGSCYIRFGLKTNWLKAADPIAALAGKISELLDIIDEFVACATRLSQFHRAIMPIWQAVDTSGGDYDCHVLPSSPVNQEKHCLRHGRWACHGFLEVHLEDFFKRAYPGLDLNPWRHPFTNLHSRMPIKVFRAAIHRINLVADLGLAEISNELSTNRLLMAKIAEYRILGRKEDD